MTLNHLIYKVTRPVGSLQVARFLARNHPRILMYHRISPDGAPGTISVDQFRKQMRLIKEKFNPISLTKLVELHQQGITAKHAVAITFDDGYSDFADYAFPILQEESIPATLFITTGFVNGDIWLWPDQLRYFLNEMGASDVVELPRRDLYIEPYLSKGELWNLLADHCKLLPNNKKLEFINNLFKDNNIIIPDAAPEQFRPVTWGQVKQMVSDGLEVGCHSYSHPILTMVREGDLESELLSSKKTIEYNINSIVSIFCYPNGQESDTSERIKELLVKYGYQYGVSAFPGIKPISDMWNIKRYAAPDNYMEFEKIVFGLRYIFNMIMR